MNDSKKSMAMKIVVNVLAVIGGIAVLSVIGMALMHTEMMGSLVC
ncbi:hypothetical protein LJR175_007358 [Variovorax sp. LjRoot175]